MLFCLSTFAMQYAAGFLPALRSRLLPEPIGAGEVKSDAGSRKLLKSWLVKEWMDEKGTINHGSPWVALFQEEEGTVTSWCEPEGWTRFFRETTVVSQNASRSEHELFLGDQ